MPHDAYAIRDWGTGVTVNVDAEVVTVDLPVAGSFELSALALEMSLLGGEALLATKSLMEAVGQVGRGHYHDDRDTLLCLHN